MHCRIAGARCDRSACGAAAAFAATGDVDGSAAGGQTAGGLATDARIGAGDDGDATVGPEAAREGRALVPEAGRNRIIVS